MVALRREQPGGPEPEVMPAPDLGGYARPPVVEVVAAVRFADLPLVISAGLGEFWRSRLAVELPDIVAQSPYQAPVEQFDRRFMTPDFNLDVRTVPPLARYWFSAASGDELVQLQPNWLACNWRKVTPDAQYARWYSRRRAFLQRYRQLSDWAEEREAHIVPNQCEVTYINHIYPMPTVWSNHADAHKVFRGLQSIDTPVGIRTEQAVWQAQYLLDADSKGSGRLHVKVQPAFSLKDDMPIFVTELTARGAPSTPSLDGVMAFLDKGREAIVKMFEATTTLEAQEGWGKE